MGLELLLERGVKNVEIFEDSQLVVRQVSLEYRCVSENLRKYFNVAIKLLSEFDNVILRHVPRELNQEASELAQIASRYKIKLSTLEKLVRIKDIFMPLRERKVLSLEKLDLEYWRVPIVEYLENSILTVDRKLKYRAQSYVLMNNVLFKKSIDGNLLTCLGEKEAYLALAEVHEGICGAHQSGVKMKWVINRRRLYWTTIQRDCINYARSCEECQKYGSLQHIPVLELHVIIKPWPFRGWVLDLIEQIHPPSSKGSTGTTPYKLVYGHDAVLPINIYLQSIRVARQDDIPIVDHWNSLHDELNELDDERLRALERVIRQKEIMSKSYNRRVKAKTFVVGDLVWKTILPIEKKSKTYGKWSPTWEGPYVVDKIYSGNAYKIIEVGSGRIIPSINGKYLKVYRPDIHEINIPHV
ncbi:hypothetical protein AAHE18_20G091900 [Arachis hypogaea]